MLKLLLLIPIALASFLAPVPAAAQFVSDTFDIRSSQRLESRQPEIGKSWYPRAGFGASVSGLGYVEQQSSGVVTFGSTPPAPGDDAVVVAAVTFWGFSGKDCARVAEECNDNYVTLIGRADISFTAYYAARVTASGSVTIYRFDGSRRVLLGSGQTSSDLYSLPHIVAFSLKDSVQEVYVDNVRIASSSNSTIKAAAQRHTGFSLSSLQRGETWLYDFQASEPPSVTSLSPMAGGPGQSVTLSGTKLSGASVRIGGKVVKPSSTSNTSLTFVTPTHSEGPAEVAAFIPVIGGDLDHYLTPPSVWTPPSTALSPVKYSYVSSKGDPEEGLPTYFPFLRAAGYRAALQLHNPADQPASGQITFHPDGGPFTADDPGFAFTLGPRETRYWRDIRQFADPFRFAIAELRMSAEATVASSMRLVVATPPSAGDGSAAAPAALAATAPPLGFGFLTSEGDTGVLLAPPSGALDLAVTTPEEARLRFDIRDAAGRPLGSIRHDYPNASLAGASNAEILGRTLNGGESIAVTVEAGAAFISAAMRDPMTSDVEIQPAASVTRARNSRRILPVAVSLSGPSGSYRTAALLHNPGDAPMELTLTFAQALSGLDSGPDAWCRLVGCTAVRGYGGAGEAPVKLVLGPHETRSIPDLVAFLGNIGIGSVEISAASQPVTLFRLFWSGQAGGSAGTLIPDADSAASPGTADAAALLAPVQPGTTMNIGIRALAAGATVELTLRGAQGEVKRRVARVVPAGALLHRSTQDLFGDTLAANDSVSAEVRSGSAMIYAAIVDPASGDTSCQFATISADRR